MPAGARKVRKGGKPHLRSRRLTAIGGLVGVGGSVALSHSLYSLLFGVRAIDPATYIVAATILAAVALVACCIPAWRAARVDPMVALRYE